MVKVKKEKKKKEQDYSHLQPWQFKKGVSGNPSGRRPGKSLKQYCKRFLALMTEEERLDFMEGLSKEVIWKMAEGNPEQEVKAGITISDLLTKLGNEGKPTGKKMED